MSAVDKFISYIHQMKTEPLDKEGSTTNVDTKETLIREINKIISKLDVSKLQYILTFITKVFGSH